MNSIMIGLMWKNGIRAFYLAVAFLPISIHACKCLPPKGIAVQKNESDLAFVGRPISTELDSNSHKIQTKFAVSEIWLKGKKEQAKWVTVESNTIEDGCGIEFKINEKVIVFSYQIKAKRSLVFETNRCLGNRLNPTQEQIDSLNYNYKTK